MVTGSQWCRGTHAPGWALGQGLLLLSPHDPELVVKHSLAPTGDVLRLAFRRRGPDGRCPDPMLPADEELYAGVYIDFMGTDAAIFRTLGKQTAMRTDQYNSRWLNGERAPGPVR